MMKSKTSMVIDLLHGCHISVCGWNECMYWETPSFLHRWSGTIKIPVTYPFKRGSLIEIEKSPKESWVTSRIITLIKERLEYMYSKSNCKGSSPNLINQEWVGEFGGCFHSIEDLWIDGLTFNPENGEVKVYMGS